MPSACGKRWEKLRMSSGKICVRLSTISRIKPAFFASMWMNARVVPSLIIGRFTPLSTGLFRPLPLYEYNFYPLSTGPITIITNFKKEK